MIAKAQGVMASYGRIDNEGMCVYSASSRKPKKHDEVQTLLGADCEVSKPGCSLLMCSSSPFYKLY